MTDQIISEKTPKIFGLGLSRTGTTSLHVALVLLGKASIHYPSGAARHWMAGDFISDPLAWFDACLDLPTPVYFRELDKAYPGSRFILTVRQEEQWLESIERFLMAPPEHSNDTQFRDMIRAATYGSLYFHRERFHRIFNEHNNAVQKYFQTRPEALLVMDVTAGDGWGKLSPFLGSNVIRESLFPNFKSPYLGTCAYVSRDEIASKRDLLEKMIRAQNT